MSSSKTVISVKQYGQIEICLKALIDARSITRNYLAKAVNTRFEVINKWYSNDVEKLDLDILARICYVLECAPSDIVKYNGDVISEAG